MRWLLCLLLLWPAVALAQSRTVLPEELSLEVTLEERTHPPYPREMVLIRIKGVYRRHITRENLIQPEFKGFNWTQLGPDRWTEDRIRGQKVKILERRMALFPERAGQLTIGAFTHHLTLTDEGDNWFDHDIYSEPITLTVDPMPAGQGEGWWFPVRELRISDDWSNAPDQLTPGEGVLRVIRLEAVGATPEMIPPMPDLTSPSAMIFPHPEKRLVELSPQGPVTYAFWRWTIRPTNDTSAILEPLSFSFFDTVARVTREVTISPQRVAYSGGTAVVAAEPEVPATLPGWPLGLLALAVFAGVTAGLTRGRQGFGAGALRRFPVLDPLAWRLWRAARAGQGAGVRRAALALLRRDGASPERRAALAEVDRALFARTPGVPDLPGLARRIIRAGDAGDQQG